MTPTPSPSSPLDPKELDEALVTAISCLDNTGFNESADTLRQFMANRAQGADPGQPAAGLDLDDLFEALFQADRDFKTAEDHSEAEEEAYQRRIALKRAIVKRAALSAPAQGPAGGFVRPGPCVECGRVGLHDKTCSHAWREAHPVPAAGGRLKLKPVPLDIYLSAMDQLHKANKAHSRIYSVLEAAWEDIQEDGDFKGLGTREQEKWFFRLRSIINSPEAEPVPVPAAPAAPVVAAAREYIQAYNHWMAINAEGVDEENRRIRVADEKMDILCGLVGVPRYNFGDEVSLEMEKLMFAAIREATKPKKESEQ